MLDVTSQNVGECCDRLESFLDAAFIARLDAQYKQLRRDPSPHWLKDVRCASFHPIHRLWRELRETRTHAETDGELRLTAGGIVLLRLLDYLTILQDCKNIERILSALRTSNSFYSSAFEAYVAAYYHSSGYRIEFPPENGSHGRQCDLIARTGTTATPIECKSLDDHRDAFRTQKMVESLCSLLVKRQLSYRVHLDLYSPVSGSLQGSISETLNTLTRDSKGARNFTTNHFSMDLECLGDWQKIYRGELTLPGGNRPEFAAFYSLGSPPPQSTFKNVVLVTAKRSIEDRLEPRVLNEIRTARDQIPKTGPGVIHIQVPHDGTERVLEFIDAHFEEIADYLRSNTRRVNAVVVTAIAIDVEERPPVTEQHYIIPNYHVRSDLPVGFALLGSNDRGLPFKEDACTIDLKLRVPPKLKPTRDVTILSHCTGDGRKQLRIWMRSGRKVRIEIVSRHHPRVFIECDTNWTPGSQHRLTATWSRTMMKVWLDATECGVWRLE